MDNMNQVFVAVLAALTAGLLGALLGDAVKFREFGPIAAIAGFIIYFNDTKK